MGIAVMMMTDGQSVSSFRVDRGNNLNPGPSDATLTFFPDGTLIPSGTTPNSDVGFPTNWYTPTTGAIGASFWLKAIVTVGTLTSGTTGVWTSMSTSQAYNRHAGSSTTQTCTVVFQISYDSAGVSIFRTLTVVFAADGT